MQPRLRWFVLGTTLMALPCAACSSDLAPPEPSSCVVPVGASPTRGPADAWVTIVEFSDFECPYCGQAETVIHEVDAERPGLRWVYKHMPLTAIHPHALAAALAAECAKDQNRFWEMHDVLFAHQAALDDDSLAGYATGLGLDLTAWNACRASAGAAETVANDAAMAKAIGVGGTPTFFIDGAPLVGAYPAEDFVTRIDRAEEATKASGTAPADYYASIEKQGCSGL
jgi:protein-disulfide isomerase